MQDPFASAVASWNNFYMLSGGAAATLVGLLFVAVSQHCWRSRGSAEI